jgi:serine protease AprX
VGLACAAVLAGTVVAAATSTATAAPASTHGAVVVKKPVHPKKGAVSEWGDDDTRESQRASKDGDWSADEDHGSLWSLTKDYGIQWAWAHGVTGKGVTVAVIDTGIAPVPGLQTAKHVVNGPDLSFDSQRPGTRYVDGYGHGTHLAGIIAGHDKSLRVSKPDPKSFAGIAPDAQLLNMKVGTADGGADVTQVIAALDWVSAHRTDNGMNVRVVNLAYGTESVQSWQVDPLARAVENAWANGLVVVTAAGNDGLAAPSLLMPAVDPHVLAVGAVDHAGTHSLADDVVASFSNGGNSVRRPDVLAPGKSVVSLRVPGSYVDHFHPEGLVTGDKKQRFFRGSGTSQATAVASGEVALLLQKRPSLTPDQVKALLTGTADPLAEHPRPEMGHGVIDLKAALAARVPAATRPATPQATGTGSIEASRAGDHVVDPMTGDVLTGEVDVLGGRWHGAAWAADSLARRAWRGGTWNGLTWTGDGWAPTGWKPLTWTGKSWSGVPWTSHTWSTAHWDARSWRDNSWLARSWRDASWLARSWRSL